LIVLAVAAGLVFAGRAAVAQDSSGAREATALALRNRCIELSRAQNFAEAVEACTRSLSLIESPNTRLDLGRAYLALGRLASALRELERSRDTARGRIDAGHQQYIRTQQAAAAEADALRPRVPTVAFQFSRTPPEQTEVAFGSVRLPARDLIAPVRDRPGCRHDPGGRTRDPDVEHLAHHRRGRARNGADRGLAGGPPPDRGAAARRRAPRRR
jgi:hypothetical protein